MKKLIHSIIALLMLSATVFAQAPQSFKYQAVARDATGEVIADQQVSFQISILQSSASGTAVYTETHIDSTNQFGLVSLEIGTGTTTDDFTAIDWGNGSYYVKIEFDSDGGTSYIEMGISQLLSVPYAFYAAEAGEYTYHALQVNYDYILPSCFGKSDGSILVSITGGQPPYNIKWSSGDTITSLENITAGNYILTVTDNKGSVVTRNISLYEPQKLQITSTTSDIQCYGEANGTIDINVSGGSYPYTYEWASGETTDQISELGPGTYTCFVFDENNCSDTIEVILDEPDTITISSSIMQNNCFNDDTASINLTISGGESPYNFSWSNGQTTEDISNLENGSYTINIYDSRNCNVSNTFEVTSKSSEITINSVIQHVTCYEDSDGNIDLSLTGGESPFGYNWSNGSTTEDISNLSADTYTLTITDNHSCEKIDSFLISSPDSISITIDTISNEFKTTSDGSIYISVSGGTSPYSYHWSNAYITEDIDSLTSATYTIEVTDSNSCTKQKDIFVNRLDSMTDIDGNKYDITKIGDQIWLAENLKTTRLNDGWEITGCSYPNNSIDSVELYGLRYHRSIAINEKICPDGWHVPPVSEWEVMINYLNGYDLAGGSLKSEGTRFWRSPNTGATNQTGFSALPLSYQSTIGRIWTSLIEDTYVSYFELNYEDPSISSKKTYGDQHYYIRCIKD